MQETYAHELIMKGKRIDGRGFADFRPIEIQTGIIKKAEGSAFVRCGETKIIAGVKMNIGKPFADTPNEGTLMVNSEFTPLASPDFESGPPGEDAVELSRIVDRGIRESKTIDLGKLVIEAGVSGWSVFVDIHIINHGGNLIDVAALAAIAALHDAQIPKYENNVIARGDFTGKLPVMFKPIMVTVGKVGNNFVIDPNLQEENVLDSKLSIAVRNDDKICALQKQGRGTLEFKDVETMIDLAIEKSKELRKLI